MYDVITITKNNPIELISTLNSLSFSITVIKNVIVVFDGKKPSLNKLKIPAQVRKRLIVVEGPCKGIYPAMNCGLRFVKNDFIFINSGDTLVGAPLVELQGLQAPIMMSCKISREGSSIMPFKESKILKKFNHNSIIFPKEFKNQYDDKYRIASDYDLVLCLTKHFGWPRKINTSGFLLYETSGVSSTSKYSRDREYMLISSKHKHYFLALFYWLKMQFNFLRRYP